MSSITFSKPIMFCFLYITLLILVSDFASLEEASKSRKYTQAQQRLTEALAVSLLRKGYLQYFTLFRPIIYSA